MLLERVLTDFHCADPNVDETEVVGEPVCARALRLAEEKALSLRRDFPDSIIIGGDQTIIGDDGVIGKPGTRDNARRQLQSMQGKLHRYDTAISVLGPRGQYSRLVSHFVRLRPLDTDTIERYLDRELATNCAGSAQIEGLGISLIASIIGGDSSALIGLPLVETCQLLRKQGLSIP